MRTRKPSLPPPPESTDPTELQAARAIAAAINQGLPGEQFCRLMNVMDSKMIQQAAAMELAGVMEWFKQNNAARYILESTRGFPTFCEAFHREARKFYPPPATDGAR